MDADALLRLRYDLDEARSEERDVARVYSNDLRALLAERDAQEREIGRLRTAFRVNMLRYGATDAQINEVLDGR